ncbi:MAG: glycosyltransferase family 39 protein, partial [Chloroflexi bacterium]|nr:glycosyltransferase family 39 protein [Chloroflexota bacterium]
MEHAVADEETAPTAHGRAISSWAYPVAVGVLLVLAFAIRIYRLEYQSIWWDESYTILTSKKGLVDILGDIGIYDVHPPLFHYALHFWMILAGSSEFGARFLSVAGGMLLVAFAIRAGQTMGNRGVALAAGLLAAVMPAWVAYSQEVRMYAFSIPLSLGSAYAFFLLVRNLRAAPGSGEREAGFALPSRRLWIGYVAVTLLAVYADYFPIYVVLFENLWMVSFLVLSTRRLPQQRGRILRLALTWAASQLVLLLLYLPWLVAALHYGIGTPLVNLTYASPPSPLSRLAGMWQGMTLGREGPAGENVLPLATVAAVLLVGLVAAWLKRRRRDVRPGIVAFLVSYFLSVCALFFASLQIWPFFHPRYILIATPPLLLLLAISIERLWRTQAIFGLTAGGLVVFFLASASRGYLFDPNLAKQDARGFVSYLNREVTSDDLVVWATRHPFPYYYRGQAPAVWLSTNPTTTLQELTELIRGHKRIFWSSWTDFPEDPWGLVPYLLGSSSTRVEKIQFRGYSATRYDLRPDASLAPVDLKPTSINFDNNVVLTGMEIRNAPAVAISSSEPIRVAMRWQSLAPINKRFKYYIYLRDEEQHLLGQYDGLILDDNQGTTAQWPVGDTGWSFAALQPFAGAPVGDYTLELGVYDEKKMKHLPVVGLTTPPVLGKIRLERPATPPAIADL